jgi:ferredoxin--NADP+ reductase
MRAVSRNYYLMTDDGTAGEKGFTTTKLKACSKRGTPYDMVIAIGPIIMMKLIVETARPSTCPRP